MEELCEDISIRRAVSKEAKEIWSITRKAYEPYRGKIRPQFRALSVSVSTIHKEIKTRKFGYGVAVCEGKIVATIRYRRRGRYLGLSRLAVHPDYQKQGLGTKMLQWVEEVARQRRVPELRGEVRAALPHLLDFYRGLGFRPFARRSGRGHKGYLIAVKKRVARQKQDGPPPE